MTVLTPAPNRWSAAPRAATASAHPIGSIIIALVLLALVSSWAAAVISVESAETVVNTEGKFVLRESKSALFYGAHGLGIASALSAAVLSLLGGRLRMVGPLARAAFVVMFFGAAAWALAAYRPEELLSSAVFSATGPFVWFSVLLVLAGANRRIWTFIHPVLLALAYLSTMLALRTLVTSQYIQYLGFSRYTQYAILLLWLGGWTLLTATDQRGWRLAVRSLPALTALLMSICTLSRSWTLQSCLVGVIFALLRSREQGSMLKGIRTIVAMGVVLLLGVAAVFLVFPRTATSSGDALMARIDDDTRSGQYTAFFAVVPPSDLILGRGPKGTWYWPGFGEYQYFDNGYLWMLFIGGVPTLMGYVIIVVAPAIRATGLRPMREDAAAVSLALLWALALTGLSTFTLPSVGFVSFLVCLWAGRCHLLATEQRQNARTLAVGQPFASWKRPLHPVGFARAPFPGRERERADVLDSRIPVQHVINRGLFRR